MILSPGFRVRDEEKFKVMSTKGKTILRKLRNYEITPEQAVYEALEVRPTFGVVPELQANFAFTKSYLADCIGSKGGFGGARMFVDLCLFRNEQVPNWIEYDDIVQFEKMGMKTAFISITDIDCEKGGQSKYEGILDAFDIGINISNDKNVVERLLKSTYTNNVRKTNANKISKY